MIYLDNAATTWPKPRPVTGAAHEAMTRAGANPGRGAYAMAEQAGELVYRTRLRACRFFGLPETEPQRVIFTPGCTWSVNTALKGTLRRGDHVIISDLEHNAVVRPLEARSGGNAGARLRGRPRRHAPQF